MTSDLARFVFLIHPLDLRDVIRFEPRAANKREPLVRKVLEWMPASVVSNVTGVVSATGRRAEGWFALVPFLPSQFVEFPKETIYEKIVTAAKLGQERGARIVGLGGYTSVVGDAGLSIAKRLEGGIAVTSGNSYTIATALQGAVEGLQRLGIDASQCRAAVVGASGSIGSVCARILARDVRHMTLVARHPGRLRGVAEQIQAECGKVADIETDLSAGVREADVVITATSSTGNIFQADDLKPGALICDVSLPHDVCRDVAEARPDVLVIEGGLAMAPGDDFNFGFDFGYPPRVSLACMAETMILALEGRYENFTLGRGISLEQVDEISALARKHGFRLAGMRSFDRFVDEDDIARVREAARLRRKGVRAFAMDGVSARAEAEAR